MKNTLIAAAIAAAGLAPVAAAAQDAPAAAAVAPTVGAKVFGPEGNEVGTVENVQGDVILINTGTARAGLPVSAFAMREKGLTIGMTKAQLEAAVQGAKPDAAAKDAAMVVDAPIHSSDGQVLGTISKVEGDDVTLALPSGASVAFKKANIGLMGDGTLAIGMTGADFAKAVGAAAAPAATETPTAE